MKPKVTLINWTPDPMETVYILWQASKVDGPVPMTVADVKRTVSAEDVQQLFWDVLRQNIPVGEHLDFVFMLEGVSVSWREQAVRHRIGVHVGDRLGVDIVPDLADSTWWSQSMRIQNMGTFAERGMYRVPESLDGKSVPEGWWGDREPNSNMVRSGASATIVYHNVMAIIEDFYRALVAAGVPMEDARELIPLGAQHRISWKLNLSSLIHILGKRGCWILQLGLWGPVIEQMVNELATKVHPMFRNIVAPPCIDRRGKFTSCLYRLENQRRVTGEDAHPICPMYLCRDEEGIRKLSNSILTGLNHPRDAQERSSALRGGLYVSLPRLKEMKERAQGYAQLWGHDPYTWGEGEKNHG